AIPVGGPRVDHAVGSLDPSAVVEDQHGAGGGPGFRPRSGKQLVLRSQLRIGLFSVLAGNEQAAVFWDGGAGVGTGACVSTLGAIWRLSERRNLMDAGPILARAFGGILFSIRGGGNAGND